jgi:tRNA-specific 2-thiouridylase
VEVRFDTPQPAVTPGQSAVFYRGERVLGGAAIRAPLRERPAAPAATGAA